MPTPPSPGSTSSYVTHVIGVLGDRDAMAVLVETPTALAGLMRVHDLVHRRQIDRILATTG